MAKTKAPRVLMIGAGHLGSLILKAWIQKKVFPVKNISVHVRSEKTLRDLKKSFPKLSLTCEEKGTPLPQADLYVIAVKPGQWNELTSTLKKNVNSKSFVISLMAGILPSQLETELGCPCLVAMTNTSLQVGTAITSLFCSPRCKEKEIQWAQKSFEPFGLVCKLEEKDFAAATALGGSHPAFAVWILNALSDIISKKLPGTNGLEWTLQIFKGVIKLIEKKKNVPEILKQIATPGGCTAEGLKALEELKITAQLAEVFERCQKKAETMAPLKLKATLKATLQ